MILQTRNWFMGLTRREQVMVGTAGALAGLILLVYGIIFPVGNALNEAAVRHAEVVERSARLIGQLEQLKSAVGEATRSQPGAEGPVDQRVAASAEAAGFVLQSNQPRGADATVITLPNAPATAALRWLDNLSGQGLAIESLTITPAADGSVAINATLQKVGA